MNNLTIAIPTYNRNIILLENLLTFLPYLPDGVEILIIDNASDVPVSITLSEVLERYSNIKISVLRNKTNIGPSANFLRCFMEVSTDWLWLIGDEDTPLESAFKWINEDINNDNLLFCGYASDNFYSLKKNSSGCGIDSFIQNIENLSALLFVSSGIYNRRKIESYLKYGYMYSYSQAPHLAIILSAIQESDEWCFRTKKIVRRGNSVGASNNFPLYPIARGIGTLKDIQNIYKSRHLFHQKLVDLVKDWLKPTVLAFEIINLFHLKKENKPLNKYLGALVVIPKNTTSIFYVIKFLMLMPFVAFPNYTISIIKLMNRMGWGKKLFNRLSINQYERM